MDTPIDDRYLALKAVMMPKDTNPWGTVFGGVTLSYIDQAAYVGAMHEIRCQGWPEQPLVTVAMNRKGMEIYRHQLWHLRLLAMTFMSAEVKHSKEQEL